MKLSTLKSEADIKSEPTGLDLDILEKIGPSINKNLTSLDSLLKLIPNSSNVLKQLENLKIELSKHIKLQSNVLELDKMKKKNSDKSVEDVCAMFESLSSELGDGAWIAISRKLRSEGMDNDSVIKIIDSAISSKLGK